MNKMVTDLTKKEKERNAEETGPALNVGTTFNTGIERDEITIKVTSDKNRKGCTCSHHSIYHLVAVDIENMIFPGSRVKGYDYKLYDRIDLL